MFSIKKSIWFPPLVVFAVIMAVVISSFLLSVENRQLDREAVANDYAKNIENDVRQRVELFEEVLWSKVGIVTVNEEFSKEDWRRYIESSSVLERFPGIQAIAYTQVVRPSEKQAYEQEARRTLDPTFTIYPEGDRDIYTAIRYIEPQNERNDKAIGYDMYSEEIRRTAMRSARDNNEIHITDPITLVQENDLDQQPGLILYAPIYANGAKIDTLEQRRQSIEGYVSVVLRTRNFLSNLLQDDEVDNLGFSFYAIDDTGDQVLYESESYQKLSKSEMVGINRVLSINGADFGIAAAYDPNTTLPESFSARSSSVLSFGTFSALLISGVTYLLLRGKANELTLSQVRSVNDAKDSLLSIASHQLRTPATGVKQYLGMVLQGFVGDISDQQKNMLDKAYESNERQLKTINDILYLARIDSARIVLTKKEVNVNGLIRSLHDELQDEIEKNNHTFKLKLPRKHILINADEHMLRMAIENIMTNAIKYTKRGGKIVLSVVKDEELVRIAVADQGVGIAEEDYDKLFKKFIRLKNELSKSVSGTGIGLYLTRYLIELHGGTVDVDSELGVGSTFQIVLPVDK